MSNWLEQELRGPVISSAGSASSPAPARGTRDAIEALMPRLDDPSFTIRIEPARKFVEIGMRGYWDAATIQRFDSELRRLLRALPVGGCRIGEQVTLFDTTQYAVQSQEVLAKLAGMAADPSIGSRRIAVLVSSALVTLQTRHIAPGYGVFTDRGEALAWLSEPNG
ncbi:hypothetical protein OF829_19005 [Sphingomonas sp. LB-2]|uniref:hypothetical protein n=1 Tax=Sphingomonas caeni TaxID=2984949 RepID=UPI00222E0811|nr:hypothetical protein [Sphingomonas caeni]MCW3849333.1 hypothetical protein [Sphingomonas caeni]